MTQFSTLFTCLICLDEAKLIDPSNDTEQKKYIKTKCQHYFHTKCLDKWLKIGYHCPACRVLLKDKPEDSESEIDPTEILEKIARLGYIPEEYQEYADELSEFLKDYNESLNEPENNTVKKKTTKRKVNIKRRQNCVL